MIRPGIAYLQVDYQVRSRLIYKSPYLIKIHCYKRILNFGARLFRIPQVRLYGGYCFQQLSLESSSCKQKLQWYTYNGLIWDTRPEASSYPKTVSVFDIDLKMSHFCIDFNIRRQSKYSILTRTSKLTWSVLDYVMLMLLYFSRIYE